MKSFFFCSFALLGSIAIAPGCSSSSSGNPGVVGSNGVNDVNKACVVRGGWAHTSDRNCVACITGAPAPRCECADADYFGACSAQQSNVTNTPGCLDARTCENKCTPGDCACSEACFAGKDACKTAAAAVDGCLAEVCDQYCK